MRRRYILNVILLLLPFSGLVAQSGSEIFEQKASFESLTDSKDYNDVCVQDDGGVYHAINGAKRIVELSSEDYTIEWIYPTIIINGEETHIDAGEQKNLISYEIENSGSYRLRLDSVKWISKDGVRDTICRNLDIDNFDIELHEAPHITRNDIEGRSKEVIWDITERELGVEYENGNDSGWTFVWKLGGGIVPDVSTNVWKRPIEKVGSQTLTLEIKNIAPNGETPWFERSFSCDFQVYRYPKDDEVKLMFRDKECPESMDWYCGDTSTDKILVSTSTGDDYNWEYRWLYAEDVVSSGNGFRPSMKDADVPSFTEGKAFEYKVAIKSCPEGMLESLCYKDTINGTVNFWKTPEINLSYADYAVVFDNTEVVVGLNVDGGIPGSSRKPTLSLDNVGVSMTENTSTQIKFRPSIDSRKKDCEYILSTSFVDENTSVELKNAINLTVWKTPEVELHYISNNSALSGRSYPVNDTIYVCDKFGGEVKLLLNKENGDDNSWTYSWKDRNNGAAETESEGTKTLTVDTAGTVYDFELEVINQPEDMKIEGFKKTIPFQVEVCPTPYINLEGIKSVYAGMHGEELALERGNGEVGKGGEWRYQWEKGGEALEGETPTLKLENSGTERITENCTAVPKYYGPLGDVWYGDEEGESKSFSVNIYPLPAENDMNVKGFDKPRLDAFYGGEKTYDIGFEGTYDYATSWEYKIRYDGIDKEEDTISGSGKSFIPQNHTISPEPIAEGVGNSQTNVSLFVRCLVKDSEADTTIVAYSEERSLDYYAWRKGEISQDMDFPKETYYNERYTLSAVPQYGYVHDGSDDAAEGGWEYEWTCNQSSGTIGLNPSYGYSNNNVNDSTTVVYALRCRNVLNGEESVAATFYYQFKEFARIVEAGQIGDYRVDVRYDDGVTFKIKAPTGGNSDGWRYEWKKEVGTSEIQMMPVTSMIDGVIPEMSIVYKDLPEGYSKHSQDVTYRFVCKNYTTDGDYVVGSEKIIEFPVRIHRKPNVESFTLKGNGKSQIYMASSASTSPEYEFGDGSKPDPYKNDPPNKAKNGSVGNKQGKWISYRYNSTPTEPWVRTYWEYEGFRCYSDACYIGEKAKAPAFSRELKVEDGYFYVNLEEEASATIRLYTLDGKIVRTQQYPPQMDFNEKLDLDNLTPGMYILQCAVGELQVVKKVVVR